jgi:hypothetical protein
MEIICDIDELTVRLNDQILQDLDLRLLAGKLKAEKSEHPGLTRREGHIGFWGGGAWGCVAFRNIRIKELNRNSDQTGAPP